MRLSLSSSLFPREYKWEVRCSIWLLSTGTKGHFPLSRALEGWAEGSDPSISRSSARQVSIFSKVLLIISDPCCCKRNDLVYSLWDTSRDKNTTWAHRGKKKQTGRSGKKKYPLERKTAKSIQMKLQRAECKKKKNQIKKNTYRPPTCPGLAFQSIRRSGKLSHLHIAWASFEIFLYMFYCVLFFFFNWSLSGRIAKEN